ncbi:hypothetical protein HQQ81_21065 [Microbacteriaceae bacterium VKM Ac-2854]|nr:hypothetical protein [Microbacteriaceae bacterium VKM Ac-2854]
MKIAPWASAIGALLLVFLVGITMSGSAAASCSGAGGRADAVAASTHAPVAGYSGDQLANAALIINAGAALGLPVRAQQIGVMTAIGESGLRNITYGDDINGVTNPDGTLTCSLGLFQQQWCLGSWGTRAEVLDPTHAATAFFTRLKGVAGYETLDPSQAAHQVQGNADPGHYTPFFAAAQQIVTALTSAAGSGTTCTIGAVSGDAKALAQNLVTALDNGQLTVLEDQYAQQLRGVAAGTAAANCGIDPRVLQLITIALNTFGKVGVSDLNRQCTGSLAGAGTSSSHWINGGGEAVDFYSLGGTALTGADGKSVQLITTLDPTVPAGARIGQSNCRPGPLPLAHFTEFDDTCNHLHVDLAYTNNAPLTITTGA